MTIAQCVYCNVQGYTAVYSTQHAARILASRFSAAAAVGTRLLRRTTIKFYYASRRHRRKQGPKPCEGWKFRATGDPSSPPFVRNTCGSRMPVFYYAKRNEDRMEFNNNFFFLGLDGTRSPSSTVAAAANTRHD